MKRCRPWMAALAAVFWSGLVGVSGAADMRAVSRKVDSDYKAAQSEFKERKQAIFQNRKRLENAVAEAGKQVEIFESDISAMDAEYDRLGMKKKELTRKVNRLETDMNGYAGVLRETGGDLFPVISGSHFSARNPDRDQVLTDILDTDRFPGIASVKALAGLIFEEMEKTGQVETFQGSFLGRDGRIQKATLLTVGPFSAAYTTPDETGLLRYSEAHQKFKALSALPGRGMRRNLEKYMHGKAESVYLDPSGGSALKRISHRSTFMEKIKKGGFLVWPILGIGVLAVFIVIERLVFLHRVHANADRMMGDFNKLAANADWAGCQKLLESKKGRPVYNVLMAGFEAVDQNRENLENILQGAILKELPRLERFLPALNVMAAVSPLIGLLGTVTGMIGTFHVITLYGTGDPRLMSGGISEALVTTMLGLAVAIPVMLFHAFLRRRIEHIVGDMEEKSVTLSNIICRNGRVGCVEFGMSVSRE